MQFPYTYLGRDDVLNDIHRHAFPIGFLIPCLSNKIALENVDEKQRDVRRD